jgi:predicted dehydrogenase
VGTLRSNYQIGGRVHSFEIHGPKASAFINLGFGGNECEAKILYASGKPIDSLAAAGVSKLAMEHLDGKEIAGTDAFYAYYGYKQEDKDFINFLLTGQKPLCTIEDAAETMEMAEMLLNNTI